VSTLEHGPALELVPFLSEERVRAIRRQFGTPVFVYDQKTLEQQARLVLKFPNAFGLTARYAMKACPTRAVVRVLTQAGLHIDASSGYEAERAMRAGVPPERIQITAQETPHDLKALVEKGVLFNASSVAQIRAFGELFPGRSLSIRINPGLGSGHSNRTNVGGPSASFGIWHEYLPRVIEIAARCRLTIRTLHTHIGSGTDPEVWKRATRMTLDLAAQLPDVTRVNLGGGFKVGRMPEEPTVDLGDVGTHVANELLAFRDRHGRTLHLEIEPGTYLVARAGAVVATCIDVADTGRDGFRFAKLDTGMTEVTRPSLYGAQHPIDVLAKDRDIVETVFVGPCCESGDILTPAPGDPEALAPRWVPRPEIGDLVVVGGAGAYCAAMSTINYNSYPQAPEVMLEADGTLTLLRRRQSLDQVWANEV